jgi:hypothetical protein
MPEEAAVAQFKTTKLNFREGKNYDIPQEKWACSERN